MGLGVISGKGSTVGDSLGNGSGMGDGDTSTDEEAGSELTGGKIIGSELGSGVIESGD